MKRKTKLQWWFQVKWRFHLRLFDTYMREMDGYANRRNGRFARIGFTGMQETEDKDIVAKIRGDRLPRKRSTYLNSVFQRPIYLRGTKNAGDDLIGKSCSTIKPEVESRTVSMRRNEPATRFTTNHGCSNSRRNFSRISVFKSIEDDSVSNLDVKMIFRFLARLC